MTTKSKQNHSPSKSNKKNKRKKRKSESSEEEISDISEPEDEDDLLVSEANTTARFQVCLMFNIYSTMGDFFVITFFFYLIRLWKQGSNFYCLKSNRLVTNREEQIYCKLT